jgi:hypothetical protein
MNDDVQTVSDRSRVIDAVLTGGPEHLPRESRLRRVPCTADTVKVTCCNGYEHFERDPAPAADGDLVVFSWTGRTLIAE